MTKRCYYEVLGIDREAGEHDIKLAFRKLAKECHPDMNPGNTTAEHQFKEVNEAYEVLKDQQRRAAYDRLGHAAFDGSHGQHGFGAEFSASMSDIFDDLFGEFMGGRRRGRSPRERGADQRYNLDITLREAFTGKVATITVPSSGTCEGCGGSGAEAGSSPVGCSACGGHGKVRASQGFFTIERTCGMCEGRGETIKNPCRVCDGVGRVAQERTLKVNIPAGIEDGNRIRLPGEGHAGLRAGPAGDLYLFISVTSDELFRRDGSDLFVQVPISMVTAALGGQIEVPTLDGDRARVKVPEGTASGTQFRLRGKGMPRLDTKTPGDMYVHVEVETPTALNRKQRDLLKELDKASSEATHPESTAFAKRSKAFWDEIDSGH